MKQGCNAGHGDAEKSPLMRGAWIETEYPVVAPILVFLSPLMRGAWIETDPYIGEKLRSEVAPHARGVD